MTVVKEKIKTLVDTMPAFEAERLFAYIIDNYEIISSEDLWGMIEEVEPDEMGRQMIYEMKNDPECDDFS